MDLTNRLGPAQATVSAHPGCLRGYGLVTVRPVGWASVGTSAQTGLLELLAAAEQVLAATGNPVALCPTYGDTSEERP